jgi:DNA-binding GntR family transcriptional regulator
MRVPGQESFPTIEVVSSLRERVYRAIEQIVVDGIAPEGSHLREDELASRLRVSRNPVREALQQLVHEGLADHRPGRGVFVHTATKKEIHDVFALRSLIESEAARLAAERITVAGLEELEALVREGAIATGSRDAHELLLLNERFHAIVLEAAGNLEMSRMMESLRLRVRWYFSRVVSARAVSSWDQHREVLAALQRRDPERARTLMATHIHDTLRALDAHWPSE